ncbi:MAG: AMP-binding protein [Gammaproteobacteria bacterium]|nr:AMP-binding protein [Gammaproteobacteria bacterium]
MLLPLPPATSAPALLIGGKPLSWAVLWQQVASAHQQLQRLRLEPGDRLLLIGAANVGQIAYLLAGWQLGLIAVPLNPRLPHPELYRRTALVAPSAGFWPSGPPNPPWTNLPPPGHGLGIEPLPWPEAELLADLVFTSGSGGAPRIVAHSFANHWHSAQGMAALLKLEAHHRYLLSLPLAHVGGLALIWRWLLSGCTLVLPQAGLSLAEQVARDQISHLSLVAAQLERLLAELAGRATLETLLLGGGPVPPALLAVARGRGWRCLMSYGLTEMTATVTAGEQGGCGKPLPGRELMISAGGEILLRGTTLAAGIWQQGALLPLAGNDGWYASGDLGHLDPWGNLQVTGRRDAQFVSGGENIQPERIEAVLLAHPGIRRALVVGVPHPHWGMRPVAYLDGDDLTLTDVRTFAAQHLARYEMPDAILPWPPQQNGLKPDRRQWQQQASVLLADLLANGKQ